MCVYTKSSPVSPRSNSCTEYKNQVRKVQGTSKVEMCTELKTMHYTRIISLADITVSSIMPPV